MNIHGHAGNKRRHPIYVAWSNMKQRCLNPKCPKYRSYGARGIKICGRWMDFINFRDDMLPTWQLGLTLERRNNNGDYTIGNCRWATRSDQQKNRRPYHLTEEHKAKLSLAKIGNKIRLGCKLSKEHKTKLSVAAKAAWARRKVAK